MSRYIFLTVRTGSSRLPNKAILDLCGKPTIQYLIDGLKKSRYAKDIILCTTNEKQDDTLCDIAVDSDIKFYRGDSEDKLRRWLGACEKYKVDFFVNVDGDDLFFDYEIADHIFEQYDSFHPGFIDGQGYLYNDVYGISFGALKHVCQTKKTDSSEYVKTFFENRFDTQKIKNYDKKWIKRNIRMTLDYEEDFIFFEKVINDLQDDLSFDNIIKHIERNPSIAKINYHLEDEWKKRQSLQKEKQSEVNE